MWCLLSLLLRGGNSGLVRQRTVLWGADMTNDEPQGR